MTLNELRIGNIIMYCNRIMIIEKQDFEWLFELNPDRTLPIPLTEEWLIKFGFEKNESGRYDKRMELSFDGKYYRFKQGWTNIEIKYVHILQNLYFALTQTELEIK